MPAPSQLAQDSQAFCSLLYSLLRMLARHATRENELLLP